MKLMLSLCFAALCALSVSGCATAPTAESYADAPAGTSCRWLVSREDDKLHKYCGDTAHWVEFDGWAPNAGVSCQKVQKRELCMTAAQWHSYNRKVTLRQARSVTDSQNAWNGGTVINPSSPDYTGAPLGGQCCLP